MANLSCTTNVDLYDISVSEESCANNQEIAQNKINQDISYTKQ